MGFGIVLSEKCGGFLMACQLGERQSIAQKCFRATDARNLQLKMAQMLRKTVFALPGCQQMSVNTLLCDTLGLADQVFVQET